MKNIKIFAVISVAACLILSCNTSLLQKKPDPRAGVDSVLFYQQADLSDPLIDAVLAEHNDEVRLTTTLIPPPPPVLQFRQIEGFRIQVFAGVDSLNTLTQLARAKASARDTVYFFPEEGLYKIHVGDYPYRIEADQAKQQLKSAGFSGAWVVKTIINIPLESADGDQQPAPSAESVAESAYTIQVLALSNKGDADLMADELKNKFGLPVSVKESAGLFKIFIGQFGGKVEAEEGLNRVRSNGYPDAWLVY